MDELLQALQDTGFSQNEAKVYIALIKNSPQNGYEAAKSANITRTMVYDILQRLLQKGAIKLIDARQKLYVPVPYKKMLADMQERYAARLNDIELAFDDFEKNTGENKYLVNITDYPAMLDEAVALIRNAEHELYLSLWPEEAAALTPELENASRRGVKIISFSFCKLPYDCGISYTYDYSSAEAAQLWQQRRLVVVADRRCVLIGDGNELTNEVSVITNNTMLVRLAIDQMLLDIIHYYQMQAPEYLGSSNSGRIEDYFQAFARFEKQLGLDRQNVPKIPGAR